MSLIHTQTKNIKENVANSHTQKKKMLLTFFKIVK